MFSILSSLNLPVDPILITGVAMCRVESGNFIDMNYKAFRSNNENMIQEINSNSIMSIIGKFTFEASELNVCNPK